MDDFTFQYNDGPLLNDEFEPGVPFVDITKVTGLDSGDFRVASRTHEGADGGFLDTGLKNMRTVVLEGTCYGDETYLEELKANWRPYREGIDATGGGAILKYAADGLQRMVRGRSLGVKYDWDQMRRTGQSAIQFQMQCEDPNIYAYPAREIGPINLSNANVSGYGYPRLYDRSYGGGTGGGGSLSVYNFGNRETYPDIHITGPCTNPFLINDTWPSKKQAILRFGAVLGQDDYIDISTRLRTVVLNGQAGRRTWLRTPYVWFGLMPGANFIRFGADAYTGAQTFLTVYDAFE